jgi:hypothetical protein
MLLCAGCSSANRSGTRVSGSNKGEVKSCRADLRQQVTEMHVQLKRPGYGTCALPTEALPYSSTSPCKQNSH